MSNKTKTIFIQLKNIFSTKNIKIYDYELDC